MSRSFSEAPFSATGSLSFSTARSSYLHRLRRQPDQVVEGEHQRLDALGRFAVALLQRGDEAGLRLAVEVVEDVRHHLVRIAPRAAREVGHEFRAQRALDAVQHVLLHALHAQHAHHDFHGEGVGQQRQHARGMIGAHLGQHHGDGLRIFVLQVVGQHRLVHVAELVPHRAAGGTADLLHDLRGAVARHGLLQQPFGAFVAADEVAGGTHVIDEIDAQALHDIGAAPRPSCDIADEMSLISSSCIMQNSRVHCSSPSASIRIAAFCAPEAPR